MSAVHKRHRSSDNEKINKYADVKSDTVCHEGPLSEVEGRDDYTSTDTKKLNDRDAFAGKWIEKHEGGVMMVVETPVQKMSSETNREEMDKFLDKLKKDKKQDMLKRNNLLKSKT